MKNYIKPEICFQSLMLSANIASGCAYLAAYAPAECGPVALPDQPNLTVFIENSECMLYSPDSSDLICYHVPTADANIFES